MGIGFGLDFCECMIYRCNSMYVNGKLIYSMRLVNLPQMSIADVFSNRFESETGLKIPRIKQDMQLSCQVIRVDLPCVF